MKVKDLMNRDVATVQPENALERAVRLMQERNCGCAVVVASDSHVLGVLTDRDVCMAALKTGKPLDRIEVSAAMSAKVFSCRPGDSIAEAERTMGLHKVRRLPVIDESGRPLGILSIDDIARQAMRDKDLFAPPVSSGAVGRTLGEISGPHLIEDADTERTS